MPTKDAAQTIETMSVPEAGRLYYGIGQTASYTAAKRGQIPVIRIGKKLRVPRRLMEARMQQPDKIGGQS
jgi:hypothetical protein